MPLVMVRDDVHLLSQTANEVLWACCDRTPNKTWLEEKKISANLFQSY